MVKHVETDFETFQKACANTVELDEPTELNVKGTAPSSGDYLTRTVVPGMNGIAQMIYRQNADKGFWDKPRNFGELLMLVTSELGEALEAHRKNKTADLKTFTSRIKEITESLNHGVFNTYDEAQDYLEKVRTGVFQDHMKDTVEDEIADAIIRLLDLCGGYNIDIEAHITEKLRYNQKRPMKHGKGY